MFTINADDLPRFMTCNGSSKLIEPILVIPDAMKETTARNEGIAAHYMATAVFNRQHTLDELIDRKAPNGVFMTGEMAEHVEKYLAAIYQNNDPDMPGFFQMELDTTHDKPPHWIVRGRTDFASRSTTDVLRIIDFKYGWSLVEPHNNWTLINHAISVWQTLDFAPSRIDLQVFQPRPYHRDGPLRTWSLSIRELMTFAAKLNDTLCNPSDVLQTSQYCKHCPALKNLKCPAARMAEMNIIDVAETLHEDNEISNDVLSFNLDNLNRAMAMLKVRLEATEELAKHRIKAGQVVDSYSVDVAYGNSKWKEGITAETLKVLTGKDLSTAKLVTPAEAKRRGVNEMTIKTLTERPMTGVKLERVAASKKAERLFGNKSQP